MARPARLPRLRLAAEILRAYLLLSWVLRRRGLEPAVARAREVVSEGEGCDPATGRRLARAVQRTLRPMPTDTRCLIRSLVLVRLIHRRGGHARLVLGGTSPSAFRAHAWVEVAGTPVSDAGGTEFGRLLEI